MLWKNFRQDLAHPFAGSVLDALNTTKQDGLGINFGFSKPPSSFSERSRGRNENNQISVGTGVEITC